MNEIILALSFLATLSIAIIGASVYAHDLRVLRPRQRVIVNTLAGHGASGVLHKRTRRTLILRDAYVTSDSDTRPPVPMDGELVIDRDQILWIQAVAS